MVRVLIWPKSCAWERTGTDRHEVIKRGAARGEGPAVGEAGGRWHHRIDTCTKYILPALIITIERLLRW